VKERDMDRRQFLKGSLMAGLAGVMSPRAGAVG
jgi:hypothetical protein